MRLPPDHALLPDEHPVAHFEKEGHDRGKESGHDHERGINFSVFSPALSPADVPAEPGFHANAFGHDQSQEGSAQAHEQTHKNARQSRRDSYPEDQVALISA